MQMPGIDYQLKRKKMWNSLEVHAIYGLFYLMCMSQEGLLHLKSFFSVEDLRVLDPIFIAQYLLVPVNTIVDNYLLPWMIKNMVLLALKKQLQKHSVKSIEPDN